MRLGLLFLFLGLLPLSAQNAQIAGMQQDLAELRNEVEKLKLENADPGWTGANSYWGARL